MTLTLAPVKVGPWVLHELLTSPQVNRIADELVKAIDGVGGGAYNPSANITLGGVGELRIDNVLRIRSGADFVVDSGATATFNESVVFNDQVDFSANVDFFDDVDFRENGSTRFIATHTVSFQSLTDLTVDDVLVNMLCSLTPRSLSDNGAGVTHWTGNGNGNWVASLHGSLAIIYFDLPISTGDVLESVSVSVTGGDAGGHGGVDPTNKIRVRLMEMGAGGVFSAFATRTDPATGAAYDAFHTITLANGSLDSGTLPHTAIGNAIICEVRSENGGTAADDENVIHILRANVTRKQLVSTSRFGA